MGLHKSFVIRTIARMLDMNNGLAERVVKDLSAKIRTFEAARQILTGGESAEKVIKDLSAKVQTSKVALQVLVGVMQSSKSAVVAFSKAVKAGDIPGKTAFKAIVNMLDDCALGIKRDVCVVLHNLAKEGVLEVLEVVVQILRGGEAIHISRTNIFKILLEFKVDDLSNALKKT